MKLLTQSPFVELDLFRRDVEKTQLAFLEPNNDFRVTVEEKIMICLMFFLTMDNDNALMLGP
jgi:hypothetical protein